jgi:hypothetical protein
MVACHATVVGPASVDAKPSSTVVDWPAVTVAAPLGNEKPTAGRWPAA